RDEWLSPYVGHDQSEPRLEGETRDEVQSAWRLCAELSTGSKHAAILATRQPGQTRRTPERRPRSAAQSNVEAWGSGDLGNLEVRMASLQAAIETHSQRILSLEGTMETRTHRLTSVERTVEKLGRVSELLRGAFSLSGSRAVELLPILERTGAASGDNIPIRVAASAEPGHVLYGPYIRLDPGSYQLEMSCRVSGHR